MHPLLSITIEAVTREKIEKTTGESELANRKKGYVTRRALLKAGAAMTAMLASPTHRTVLLFGRWRTLGVGARASCDGQVIYALDFLG